MRDCTQATQWDRGVMSEQQGGLPVSAARWNQCLLSDYSRVMGAILDFMNTQLWASKPKEEKRKRLRRDHGLVGRGTGFVLHEKDHCSFEFYCFRKWNRKSIKWETFVWNDMNWIPDQCVSYFSSLVWHKYLTKSNLGTGGFALAHGWKGYSHPSWGRIEPTRVWHIWAHCQETERWMLVLSALPLFHLFNFDLQVFTSLLSHYCDTCQIIF